MPSKEAIRTPRLYNLDLVSREDCSGVKDWFPQLKSVDVKPDKLIGFNYGKSLKTVPDGAACHFFLDDYQFERIWSRPLDYLTILRRFSYVIAPDFSLYTDMPVPLQLWNLYRSRALAFWWQSLGLAVVPVLQWSDESAAMFCFEGMPTGGTVAVSTIGVRNSQSASTLWLEGFKQALQQVRPSRVLLYGEPVNGFEKPDGVEIVEYSNSVIERVRKHGR